MPRNDDISKEIDLIIKNMPDNLEEIEKVRWLYIKLGYLFSYDLEIVNENNDVRSRQVIYELDKTHEINRYQSCIQISELLVQILSLPQINIKSKVIDRIIERDNYTDNHKAIAIYLTNNEKYLLDLTLDLYLIQS